RRNRTFAKPRRALGATSRSWDGRLGVSSARVRTLSGAMVPHAPRPRRESPQVYRVRRAVALTVLVLAVAGILRLAGVGGGGGGDDAATTTTSSTTTTTVPAPPPCTTGVVVVE